MSSQFTVKYSVETLAPLEFMLYDSRGRLVMQQKIENVRSNSGELNWIIDSQLATGEYYMVMQQKGKKLATCKIIKTQ